MTDHVLYGIKVSQSVTIIEWDQVKFCISKIDLIIANITAKGVYFGAFWSAFNIESEIRQLLKMVE